MKVLLPLILITLVCFIVGAGYSEQAPVKKDTCTVTYISPDQDLRVKQLIEILLKYPPDTKVQAEGRLNGERRLFPVQSIVWNQFQGVMYLSQYAQPSE